VGNSCVSRRVEGTSEEAKGYQVMSMMVRNSFIPYSNASICEFFYLLIIYPSIIWLYSIGMALKISKIDNLWTVMFTWWWELPLFHILMPPFVNFFLFSHLPKHNLIIFYRNGPKDLQNRQSLNCYVYMMVRTSFIPYSNASICEFFYLLIIYPSIIWLYSIGMALKISKIDNLWTVMFTLPA